MKEVTIRDLRQRWPEVEKWLQREGELVLTRDGQPVARILLVKPREKRRGRFDAKKHAAWMKRVWGNRMLDIVDASLAEDREDD